MKSLVFLLFSIGVFSQDSSKSEQAKQKPLELKIDRIEITDESNERKYTVQYHITNLTDKELAFVLNTQYILPIASASLMASPYYKIYENGKVFEATGVFSRKGIRRNFANEEEFKKFADSLATAENKKSTEELLNERKAHIISNIQRLEPNETLSFKAILLWNKQRYYKNDAVEYYIGEKDTYDFELHIHLMDKMLLRDLEENQREEILKGQNLTTGWYTSNKVTIDFGE